MSLTQDIRKDMFEASKLGDANTSNILKMVLAEIKNEEISKGESLSDDEVLKVLRKAKKRVEDSISQFKQMDRQDLVEKEAEQLKVLEGYLPALMSEEEITVVVEKIIQQTNPQGLRDMGKVMGMSMKQLDGKADGNTVKDIVQKLLS